MRIAVTQTGNGKSKGESARIDRKAVHSMRLRISEVSSLVRRMRTSYWPRTGGFQRWPMRNGSWRFSSTSCVRIATQVASPTRCAWISNTADVTLGVPFFWSNLHQLLAGS